MILSLFYLLFAFGKECPTERLLDVQLLCQFETRFFGCRGRITANRSTIVTVDQFDIDDQRRRLLKGGKLFDAQRFEAIAIPIGPSESVFSKAGHRRWTTLNEVAKKSDQLNTHRQR